MSLKEMNSNLVESMVESKICPECQHRNRMENKFCTDCGEGFAEKNDIGPCLTILTREKSSIVFQLKEGKNTIGRNINNMIVINDDQISNFHATILLIDGQSKIIDLGSKNGIYINGRKVRKNIVLKNGHLIKLGSTFLRYESSRDSEIIKKAY